MGTLIVMTRHFQAPVERVWDALVNPAQVGTWLAARANIVPERGGPYELFWLPDTPDRQSTMGCRITAIVLHRYLAYTWRGPDELSAIMNEGDPPPAPTHVTFSLAGTPEGTGLRMRHIGFGEGEDWSGAVAWHERAWSTSLGNLEAFLAGQPLPRPWSGD